MENEHIKSLISEVASVKSLLILQALALGCQQKHVAAALGVSDATLSRMFPKGFAKQIVKAADRRVVGGRRND
jgi:DNA-binding transcriptional regulator LsrR (DeoR family)